jgi:protein O-GlcNAc transferase
MRGNLLYAMYHHPGFDANQLRDQTRDWALHCALPQPAVPTAPDLSPSRRLKIGYLSPFFFRCADANFIVPLLNNHDSQQYEIFCYSRIPEAKLERSYFPCHHFHDITPLGPQGAAELIASHKIDILIAMCRPADDFLRVLTFRAAPVQMTWLTFASATTGIDAVVDYRISDPFVDPIGSDEGAYVEKTLRLPETAWCYDPMLEAPPVGPVPALANQHVTFGALGRWCKINPSVLSAWASVLKAAPNSRLLLLSVQGSHRQRAMEELANLGIDPSRIEIIPRTSRYEYLRLYNRVDVTLDTFPFSGHTTALDSLWMGVPVVTLCGETCVGRAADSALNNLALTEWIAKTPNEFVSMAVRFSQDLPNLSRLRVELRRRFQSSALGDGPRFTRQMESLYRQAWQHWCG